MEFLLAPSAFRSLGAPVTAAAFLGSVAGLAAGDGALHLWPEGGAPVRHGLHAGAILSLAADAASFLTGGDDGQILRTVATGETVRLHHQPRAWIEHLLPMPSGLIAVAARRDVLLLGADGAERRRLAHPSTVTGLATDARARRLAASHYNGVSLWWTQAEATAARLLEWKGSHVAVALHPEAKAVVSAMQENELHGWRLPDAHDMRMSGYPSKCESLAFTRSGRWLATAGAGAIVCWPFFGGGPMGREPTELAPRPALCTRVAAHPRLDAVAAGFADGMVVLAETGAGRVVPIADGGTHGAITALAFSADGRHLAIGTETGHAALATLE